MRLKTTARSMAVLAVLVAAALTMPKAAAHGGEPTATASSPGTLLDVGMLSRTDGWSVGSGENNTTRAMHWDGQSWTRTPTPSPATGNSLASVAALSTNDVWAVGEQIEPQRYIHNLIEHWDGSTWRVVPSPNHFPNADRLLGVDGVSADDVWAVGTGVTAEHESVTEILHWDGSRWRYVPSPVVPGPYSALADVDAISATNVWAVGNTSDSTHSSIPLIEHYDGRSWTVVLAPRGRDGYRSFLRSVSGSSPSDIWAVGSVNSPDFAVTGLTLHWDGARWSSVRGADADTAVPVSVDTLSARNAWAVGLGVGPNGGESFIEHWDGRTWTRVPSANPRGSTINILEGVDMVDATSGFAVGEDGASVDSYTPMLQRWAGGRWFLQPSP